MSSSIRRQLPNYWSQLAIPSATRQTRAAAARFNGPGPALGRELRTLTGHSDTVWAVAVSGDGQRVVSASYDGTVKVWDLASGRELRTLTGHSLPVTAVAVTGDGQRAVSASSDRTLKV